MKKIYRLSPLPAMIVWFEADSAEEAIAACNKRWGTHAETCEEETRTVSYLQFPDRDYPDGFLGGFESGASNGWIRAIAFLGEYLVRCERGHCFPHEIPSMFIHDEKPLWVCPACKNMATVRAWPNEITHDKCQDGHIWSKTVDGILSCSTCGQLKADDPQRMPVTLKTLKETVESIPTFLDRGKEPPIVTKAKEALKNLDATRFTEKNHPVLHPDLTRQLEDYLAVKRAGDTPTFVLVREILKLVAEHQWKHEDEDRKEEVHALIKLYDTYKALEASVKDIIQKAMEAVKEIKDISKVLPQQVDTLERRIAALENKETK